MGFRLANISGRAALVAGDEYYDVETLSGGAVSSDPMAALAAADQLSGLSAGLADATPTGSMAGADVGPPVPAPRNVYGIGLNYRNHAAESNMDLPDKPVVFTKFPSCIVGPTATVEIRSERCDYEAELVVVIGSGGRDIPVESAWDHVAGVTCGQDISDRAVQLMAKPPQFALGKSFDTFGPLGPVVVSVDELADRDAIGIRTTINDEVRQDDTTANLIFDVPTLVSVISRITTLSTGDLIFTGTPEGVGAAQRKYLADGDTITTEIHGVGTMVNPVSRIADHQVL